MTSLVHEHFAPFTNGKGKMMSRREAAEDVLTIAKRFAADEVRFRKGAADQERIQRIYQLADQLASELFPARAVR